MNSLAIIESIQNFFDGGVFIESLRNSLRVKMEMELKDFIRQLLFGKGYAEVTPPDLSKQMEMDQDLLIVDLRDKRKYEKAHIKGAVSHPFDDFLRSVLVDTKYREFEQKNLVLVCDTGHQSRVAAGILAEEGFMKVSSLKRGMRRWSKWQKLLRVHEGSRNSRCHVCELVQA